MEQMKNVVIYSGTEPATSGLQTVMSHITTLAFGSLKTANKC
jgi:hypothetical protein